MVKNVPEMKNEEEQLLDAVQQRTFEFFRAGAHPESGLIYDVYPCERDMPCVSGGTGMGMMVYIMAVERGFISRADAAAWTLKVMQFLKQKSPRYHGAWSHYINGDSGTSREDDYKECYDLVETTFVVQGLLTAHQYFDGDNETEKQIRQLADDMWRDVDWQAFTRHNNTLAWSYVPERNEWAGDIRGFNECMLVYLLGIASPTHPIDPACYFSGFCNDFGGQGYTTDLEYDGIKQYIQQPTWGMNLSLFWTHYSFLGLDPHCINDGMIPEGLTYFDVMRNISLINRQYCINNPNNCVGYDGLNWGLTASYDPYGYLAHAPAIEVDNGTITPSAALSAMPYTPEESIATMKHFIQRYPERLWAEYGFTDAFNLSADAENGGWFCEHYVAIDQAPIAIMIENYRTGLLWDLFMSHPDIQRLIGILRKSGWTCEDRT